MKPVFFLLWLVVMTVACSTPKSASKMDDVAKAQTAAADTTEYEVETFNKRFDQWYQKYQDPAKYKSQAYYESWNEQYVAAWNAKCARGGKDWHFDPVVGYKANEDYGFEMNHKLFYYFMYVENVLKIQILPGGPKDYKP
ncbi:MAG TPA: DUF6146 family protein [Draconibacterium sp.]|nr:DUF6146 family protein [Draconibacterium sp.]